MFRLILAAIWILQRVPDRPVYRMAYVLGAGIYLLMPERRRMVRANLQRVCDWLVANDLATPRVARAAGDRRALERMVRATFGHWVVTYVEAVMAPRYDREELLRRLERSDPEATAEAMAAPAAGLPGPIHMAIHYGAVDLSALYGARVGAVPVTGPMETVQAPLARAYFERVRDQLGVTIVPLGDAITELVAALKRGEAIGVVADRNIVGRGTIVELFGAPARMPTGPAVLSVQTGAPLYLEVIERTGPGAWLGHTVRLRPPPGTKRREAARSIVDAEMRAMERLIARAPEQWTTLFFPIWEDESDA
jgi:KDO2-lipid IV(A) lauroyltransferase